MIWPFNVPTRHAEVESLAAELDQSTRDKEASRERLLRALEEAAQKKTALDRGIDEELDVIGRRKGER